ncbi:hypothetical protein GOBAR_AA10009 [Gossypium barbadense]|uniref:ADP-ribosyl cyclase/cyclic ADP-ribose hydrolase n=1 Tax=Gossypium barbadense TaxID=3634 RepID=A0A2P5Y4U7_GOSBA|nr:hypothetical protein GOBAR_AA10009 [Gossypium barbadense]
MVPHAFAVGVRVVDFKNNSFTRNPIFFHQIRWNTNMLASTSSSSAVDMIKARTYDVFLSFRGEDTRDGFLSHLYNDLCRKTIETFIDSEKLRRGDEISEALLTAIQGSRVSVIVFSKDYASSRWCLDELVKIMDCNKCVVPVFYGVDPSDVRKQRGSFADAFAKHEENFKHELERVKSWRSALTAAANLSGWDSQVTRPDSILVDKIVKDIMNKLNCGTSNANLEGLVGIERRMQKVLSLFQDEIPDFRKLGIWGMGGTGKTTLAEAIFHHVLNGFQSYFFLANVREYEERGKLFKLRQKFLSAILEDENLCISTSRIGSGFLKDRLSRKKVLVVCDDVSKLSQLEFLFGGNNRLGPGSRVIVTTRDKQVLIQYGIDLIYEMKELDEDESIQLFSQHAFKSNNPMEYHQLKLSQMVLSFANGNPLAIKVIGSSLCGKTKSYQESEVKKLKQVPNPDIQKLLKWSFDGLECEEKEMFLDIACFFKGKDRDIVTWIMDSCYGFAYSRIENLIDKSLISVSQNQIAIHDLLQQMGWNIVCNESPLMLEKRSRLWIPEDSYDVLTKNNLRALGIVLDMSKLAKLELEPIAFMKMQRLRFLKFYHTCGKILLFKGLLSFPNELRYLYWEGYPLRSLPTKFDLRYLVELDMRYSNVKQLWEGKQDLGNLKVIRLHHSKNLVRIPDLSSATNLEKINLRWCFNLIELPSSLQHLEKLTLLNFSFCKNLRSLPSFYKATSLTKLYLSGCSNLFSIGEVSPNVTKLCLEGIAIEELPSSIECLTNLRVFYLWGCRRLKSLPSSIHKLKSLEYFDLQGCSRLEIFPEIMDTMERLRVLDLSGTALKGLPSSIDNLVGLEDLRLNYCEDLVCLPKSFYKLESLENFNLGNCSILETFPEILDTMEEMYKLDLSGTALKELPSSITNLIGLKDLRLNNCQNLICLPNSFYKLKSLELFSLEGCSRLEIFPEIMETMERLFYKLKSLEIFNKDLNGLSSLHKLDLSESNLENLPTTIKQFPLHELILRNCKRLKSLPELPPSLVYLDAYDCTSLKDISSIKKLFEQELFLFCKPLVWLFTNCFQLVQKAVSSAKTPKLEMPFEHMVTLLKDYHQVTCIITCVPGSEIPEWFDFKSLGSSINIQLPSEWCSNNSWINFPCFVASAVVSFPDSSYSGRGFGIRCECHLKSCNGDNHCFSCSSSFSFGSRLSDHVFLLYDGFKVREIVKIEASNNRIYNVASFHFYIEGWGSLQCEVKQCGIHLLFPN